MEIRRIDGRRRVEQVADREFEPHVVLENGDLLLPLVSTAHIEEFFEELARGIDVRDLYIHVVEPHRSSASLNHPDIAQIHGLEESNGTTEPAGSIP
jgi:hypothetical protein